ncbi:hypothetical protein SLE2022_052430 [Rubroshorea leprosula]
MSNRNQKSTAPPPADEVEQLLQATQDEMLLQLSIDTHMSRVAPDYLESDLDRRFQALKSKPSARQPQSRQSSAPKQQQQQQQNQRQEAVVDDVDQELRSVLGDDLSARFAALKASSSSSSSTAINDVRAGTNVANSRADDGFEDHQDDKEDEVEKVIRWAMDAARLDPSPPFDDEDDHNKEESDDDDDDDDEDEDEHRNKKPVKK